MIEITSVNKFYGTHPHTFQVLKDINLTIDDGVFMVILGASGSGKTTLLNVISGLEKADGGSIKYDSYDITKLDDKKLTRFRRETVGFVFQQYYLLSNMNVKNNIKMGADLSGIGDFSEIAEKLGLKDQLLKYPSELSGGQQQRVSVARALAKKPKVLFMDEPTGALDEETGRELLNYLAGLHQESKFTIVMVTHNQNIAEMADVIVKMNSGRITDIAVNDQKKTAYQIGW